jgi:hypothetical protein
MSCTNQPVANLASSPGGVYGGHQVTATASGTGLAWGVPLGYMTAVSESCTGNPGWQVEYFDPNGCNPPPPPPPTICEDPNDACYGQTDCCGPAGGGGGGGAEKPAYDPFDLCYGQGQTCCGSEGCDWCYYNWPHPDCHGGEGDVCVYD